MMKYYIGIDIGTYETKGVIVNSIGKIETEIAVAHQLVIPQSGWAEHDVESTWWGDVVKVFNSFKIFIEREQINKADILSIGISSIAPSVVPIDENGKPLRNAILYGIDTRTVKQIDRLNREIGQEKILAIGKQELTTQAGGPKILWIKENEPHLYLRTKYFLSGASYIGYKLTGKAGLDHYTAASFAPLYDYEKKTWSKELVPYVTEFQKLPDLGWSTDKLGTLKQEIAEEFGLSSTTKVLFGTTDALAEAISCGSVEVGDLMLMYGSSTFFILNANKATQSSKMWPNLHVVENVYSLTGGTSTAGSLTRWYIDLFQARDQQTTKTFKEFGDLAGESAAGANGVICLPHFSGERTPINNPNAKGVFFGLSLKNTKGDLYRAILEGVAYSIKQNIEYMRSIGLEINRIISIGGGTKNRLWLQIVSDVCGIEQIVTQNKVGAAYGNAFLCSIATGQNSSLSDIMKWLIIEENIQPNESYREIYDKGYEKYLEIYKQLEKLM